MKTTKRTTKGQGSLYIRDKYRKRFKAGTKVEGGAYWLEYWQPVADGRKKKRIPLKHTRGIDGFVAGDPVTLISHARHEQKKITDQFVNASIKDRLTVAKAELETAEQKHVQSVDEANPPLTVADAWKQFEGHPDLDCGATSLYNYQGHWKQFTDWLDTSVVYMRDVTKATAMSYARHLNSRKVSPGTYNKHINFLKLIFTTLKEESRIEVSPFADLKSKKLASAKAKADARNKKRRELNTDELIDLIDSAEGDLKPLLMLGAYTGLRLGDCCTLKWGECFLDRGMIKRVPNKTQSEAIKIGIPPRLIERLSETPKSKRKGYVLPKFAEDYIYVSKSGKNGHRTRITNRIQKHIESRGIQTHADGTGFRLEPDPEQAGQFKRVSTGKRAVVEVGFHSLRHTFVSLQAERGISLAVIQKIVGHGSPAMTEHYSHISDKSAIDATLELGVQDAEFEVLPDPIPDWALELIKKLNTKNVAKIKKQLLEAK